MGSAIDLFVSYRFLKLLTTPFQKTEAFKLGIIDKKGHRILKDKSSKPEVELSSLLSLLHDGTKTKVKIQKTNSLKILIRLLLYNYRCSIFN